MKAWINLGFLFLSVSCFADAVKPAVLDLKCTEVGGKNRVVFIQSDKTGSEIIIGTKSYKQDEQLIAGTEGEQAFIEAVNNDAYNITIQGDDFGTAFNESSEIQNGSTSAYVQLLNNGSNISYIALCSGFISFKKN